jgi:multicomponent Na+:H+ antiporter subunit F
MIWGNFGEMTLIVNLVYVMLGIAMILTFIRLVVGPSLPDRVISLDLMAALSVGVICTYAIGTEQRVFLDVAFVLALITFLGTVAFAQYAERRARDD